MRWSCACNSMFDGARCRWDGDNGPEQTDWISNQNLIAATPKSVKRFVFTTSAGVERSGQFPFFILNLFGAAPAPPRRTRRCLSHISSCVLWSPKFGGS